MNNYNSKNVFGTWIIINDNIYTINYNLSLKDVIQFLDYKNCALVSEHNQKIVTKYDEKFCTIKGLDKIEFVTIVGGG
uniref:Thiamine biosynthesis protein n=1 Tax=Eustigmatophyceae sp. Mont 10/10-1w TaxID=2506145 RepID=A0A3R5QLX0_9STRA|nr:Thiamine biosynthesis protein [Eustigmatophyceae sp. Mont 10/10-1w]QAA11722.1 Thiamine biosynthesis protein [Eustigmatophyceae sp. Mont 10/10-1w]